MALIVAAAVDRPGDAGRGAGGHAHPAWSTGPGPLKVQQRPVPYLGGVAVFAGLAGPVAWAQPALLVPLGLALAARPGGRRRRRVTAASGSLGEVAIGGTAALALPGSLSPLGCGGHRGGRSWRC